jgi:hypothetical protein
MSVSRRIYDVNVHEIIIVCRDAMNLEFNRLKTGVRFDIFHMSYLKSVRCISNYSHLAKKSWKYKYVI